MYEVSAIWKAVIAKGTKRKKVTSVNFPPYYPHQYRVPFFPPSFIFVTISLSVRFFYYNFFFRILSRFLIWTVTIQTACCNSYLCKRLDGPDPLFSVLFACCLIALGFSKFNFIPGEAYSISIFGGGKEIEHKESEVIVSEVVLIYYLWWNNSQKC